MVSPFPLYCCGGVSIVIALLGRGILALSLRRIWRGKANMIPTHVSDEE